MPELQQARRLWQANRLDEALELFEKAVRKYPQNLVALVDASRALGARFEISRAEAIVDRLAKVADDLQRVVQVQQHRADRVAAHRTDAVGEQEPARRRFDG